MYVGHYITPLPYNLIFGQFIIHRCIALQCVGKTETTHTRILHTTLQFYNIILSKSVTVYNMRVSKLLPECWTVELPSQLIFALRRQWKSLYYIIQFAYTYDGKIATIPI